MAGDDWAATRWIDDVDAEPDDADGPPRRRRGGLLLLAAALPWIVVVGLLVLPGRIGGASDQPSGASDDHPAGPDAPLASAADADPTEASTPDAGGPDVDAAGTLPSSPGTAPSGEVEEVELLELRGAWRVHPGDEAAAALGVAVARAWLTTMEPRLELAGLDAAPAHRYAEHLVVEAVERFSAHAATVTVLAIVLDAEEVDQPLEAAIRRLAVPIVWDDDGPRPGGEPWPLTAPTLVVTPPADVSDLVEPEDQLLAITALQSAGYGEVELVELGASAHGPVVARIRADGPDGEPVDGAVWLRRHLDGFVVSGTALSEHRSQTPAEHPPGGVPLPHDLGPSSQQVEDGS